MRSISEARSRMTRGKGRGRSGSSSKGPIGLTYQATSRQAPFLKPALRWTPIVSNPKRECRCSLAALGSVTRA